VELLRRFADVEVNDGEFQSERALLAMPVPATELALGLTAGMHAASVDSGG